MKPSIMLILLLVLLSACSPALTATPVSTQPLTVAETPTPLLSAVEIPSATPTTSETPTLSPTRTITPLPTIPTFTPTFDTRTIVTATPAPKAECPKGDSSLKLNVRFDDHTINADEEILKFLNSGGSMKVIVNELAKVYGPSRFRFIDVTNDGQLDLIFDGFLLGYDTFYIVWCQNGQYYSYSDKGVAEGHTIYDIIDMNKDGVPEIVIYSRGCSGNGCYRFFVGEWNGETFVNLARQADLKEFYEGIYLEGVFENEIIIRDMNGDGTLELQLTGGSYDFSPPRWRKERYVYTWNSAYFMGQLVGHSAPVYHFQAVQDADQAALQKQYKNAFDLYRNAIFDTSLKGYSPVIADSLYPIWEAKVFNKPVPTSPSIDPTEYPRLSAYAYYRMVILHTQLGEMETAQVKYATLQEKFPAGNPGHPYVEMATDFWNAYQSSGKMYDACAAAIAYADAHPEILIPLGSDYHGAQSHIYVPADVCPFR